MLWRRDKPVVIVTGAPKAVILTATESPAQGTFDAIFALLDESSRALIGPAQARPLAVPLHDSGGGVIGGLWAATLFAWLHVQLLFVPVDLRGRGIGAALLREAERAAAARGCHGACVDTFSFQATAFYEKLGYVRFGILDEYPPGYQRIYYRKTLVS